MQTETKILVVDDEARICQNVEKILSKNNYQVTRAASAQEALEKMAVESFGLLISDIVMPGMNGLELLKLVKSNWPLTKAVMMTAYASTDTAVKAIRLGALDYLPKPFTPDELRATIDKALSGELVEFRIPEREKEAIQTIDLDIPFDRDEVAKYTGDEYADSLGPSDMPVVQVKARKDLENYCELGDMVCDIFKKLGATCKSGVKKNLCPQKAKAAAGTGTGTGGKDARKLIGIDMPFDYNEVSAITGPEYLANLHGEGVAFVPYETLKARVAADRRKHRIIDVDMPFDREEVANATGEAYPDQLKGSEIPTVEITASAALENFCELGDMVCDIFAKLGATCKVGVKKNLCPQKAKTQGKAARAAKGMDVRSLVGIDMPFDYRDVIAATGPEYVANLHAESVSVPYYEELKARFEQDRKIRAAEQQPHPALPAEPATRQILVIDDEVAVNNNIRKILARNSMFVEQAVNRDEALAKLQARDYKLILLDLKIPGVRGLELLKAVREHQPEAKVIIITGYASIETAVESARMGVIDYLPKPFTPDEIRAATEKALRFAA